MNNRLRNILFTMTSDYYRQPHRSYHRIHHIEQMLGFMYKQFGEVTNAQMLATFFHDAVYIPYFEGNEEASAILLRSSIGVPLGSTPNSFYPLQELVTSDDMDNAYEMILASKHHLHHHLHHDMTEEQSRFLDADLSILSASEDEYNIYCDGIYKEWAVNFGHDVKYIAEGRIGFLKSLLQRNRIYYTLHQQFDHSARDNMWREITELKKLL